MLNRVMCLNQGLCSRLGLINFIGMSENKPILKRINSSAVSNGCDFGARKHKSSFRKKARE